MNTEEITDTIEEIEWSVNQIHVSQIVSHVMRRRPYLDEQEVWDAARIEWAQTPSNIFDAVLAIEERFAAAIVGREVAEPADLTEKALELQAEWDYEDQVIHDRTLS